MYMKKKKKNAFYKFVACCLTFVAEGPERDPPCQHDHQQCVC